MTDLAQVAARQARRQRRRSTALPVRQRARLAPTARSSGCSTSAAATRSKPSSSPRTTAARCASRRRPAAPSAAASAPPATRASAATSRTAEIVAQLWYAEHRPAPTPGLAAGERAITNVVMMGMGEPLQNYAALRAGAARHARRPRLRPVAPPRHGLDLGRGADDRPAARRLPGGAGGVAARARTTRCATSWCR